MARAFTKVPIIPVVKRPVPSLNFPVPEQIRKLRTPEGPLGRLKILRYVVCDLFKLERIKVSWDFGHEARPYAERVRTERSF
jgi:hypothetical protein